jgi:hypothetical protein
VGRHKMLCWVGRRGWLGWSRLCCVWWVERLVGLGWVTRAERDANHNNNNEAGKEEQQRSRWLVEELIF